MYRNIVVIKLLVIKIGFWDNVRKYNGEKLVIEIKLGFWDNVLKYNSKKIVLEIKLGFWDNVRT